MGVNYGFEKVRFLAPVPSGSKIRGRFNLKDAVEKKPGQFLLTYEVTVDIEGQDKPALIADWLAMQFTGQLFDEFCEGFDIAASHGFLNMTCQGCGN